MMNNLKKMTQSAVSKRRNLAWTAPVALAAGLSLTAGCVSAPEPHGASTQWRFLPAKAQSAPVRDDRAVVVRLIETRASSGIDRRDMAYTTERQSIAYYRDNRWAASPAVMLNEVIDETLTAQPWVRSVIRGGARVPADLSLYCEVHRLEHEVDADGGQVHLRTACSWYRAAERELVSASVFNQRRAIGRNDAAHFAEGAQWLVDRLLAELVRDGRALAVNGPERTEGD
jgi:cholesterol transport system auxiliary component